MPVEGCHGIDPRDKLLLDEDGFSQGCESPFTFSLERGPEGPLFHHNLTRPEGPLFHHSLATTAQEFASCPITQQIKFREAGLMTG